MEKEFVQLINQHVGLIYKVCHLYCQEPEDRKDLFQEIVLQLWKGYPHFKKEAQFATWLYRVALNTAISNYRKINRRPRSIAMSDEGFDVPDPTVSQPGGEAVQLLHKGIQQLNAIEKAMIMLHLEGCTYQEMAAILGISPNNVGVKLNRIKTKLEKILKQYRHEYK